MATATKLPEKLSRLKFGKVLGSGQFATVQLVTDPLTGNEYAMKIIDKARCRGEEQHIIQEVTILKDIKHPNVIRLFEVFETREKIYLQLELVKGGELFDRIVAKGYFSEHDAKRVINAVCGALDYLHSRNVAHRDLKPENLLLSDDSDDAEIKIADFGLSTASGGNTMLETFCGTLSYVAPEVLQSKGYHGKPVDMWAVGVITYILLCGYPPFYSEDDNEITELTLKGEFRFISPDWDHVSQDAKDFISALLILNPEERLTAKLALHHPWLTIDNDDEEAGQRLKDDETGSIMVENLRKLFNARNKFKGAVQAAMFLHKLGINDSGKSNEQISSGSIKIVEIKEITAAVPSAAKPVSYPAAVKTATTATAKGKSTTLNVKPAAFSSATQKLTANPKTAAAKTAPVSVKPNAASVAAKSTATRPAPAAPFPAPNRTKKL